MSKRVSLSDELTTLFEGVRGARGLVEKIRQNQCSDDREHAETANAVVAFLVLLTERLRLLDRVVRGTVDGAVLSCPQNEAITREGSEVREGEEDIILRAWSEKRLLRHHRAEWKRAKRRLAREKVEKAGAP